MNWVNVPTNVWKSEDYFQYSVPWLLEIQFRSWTAPTFTH